MKPETLLLIIKDILDEYTLLEGNPMESIDLSYAKDGVPSLTITLRNGQSMRLLPTQET